MASDQSELRTHSSHSRRGRPPVMTDAELTDCVDDLYSRLGRWPTTGELIAEAGACQKVRACAAIAFAKSRHAQREIAKSIELPEAMEAELRHLMVRWLELAASQVEKHTATRVLTLEGLNTNLQTLLSDLRGGFANAQDKLDNQKERIEGLEREQLELTSEIKTLTLELARQTSISEERGRLLERFQASDSARVTASE